MTLRIGFLVSHPIQYYAPIFRALAERCDLTVYFAHRQSADSRRAQALALRSTGMSICSQAIAANS
jgi:hypothetical protein